MVGEHPGHAGGDAARLPRCREGLHRDRDLCQRLFPTIPLGRIVDVGHGAIRQTGGDPDRAEQALVAMDGGERGDVPRIGNPLVHDGRALPYRAIGAGVATTGFVFTAPHPNQIKPLGQVQNVASLLLQEPRPRGLLVHPVGHHHVVGHEKRRMDGAQADLVTPRLRIQVPLAATGFDLAQFGCRVLWLRQANQGPEQVEVVEPSDDHALRGTPPGAVTVLQVSGGVVAAHIEVPVSPVVRSHQQLAVGKLDLGRPLVIALPDGAAPRHVKVAALVEAELGHHRVELRVVEAESKLEVVVATGVGVDEQLQALGLPAVTLLLLNRQRLHLGLEAPDRDEHTLRPVHNGEFGLRFDRSRLADGNEVAHERGLPPGGVIQLAVNDEFSGGRRGGVQHRLVRDLGRHPQPDVAHLASQTAIVADVRVVGPNPQFVGRLGEHLARQRLAPNGLPVNQQQHRVTVIDSRYRNPLAEWQARLHLAGEGVGLVAVREGERQLPVVMPVVEQESAGLGGHVFAGQEDAVRRRVGKKDIKPDGKERAREDASAARHLNVPAKVLRARTREGQDRRTILRCPGQLPGGIDRAKQSVVLTDSVTDHLASSLVKWPGRDALDRHTILGHKATTHKACHRYDDGEGTCWVHTSAPQVVAIAEAMNRVRARATRRDSHCGRLCHVRRGTALPPPRSARDAWTWRKGELLPGYGRQSTAEEAGMQGVSGCRYPYPPEASQVAEESLTAAPPCAGDRVRYRCGVSHCPPAMWENHLEYTSEHPVALHRSASPVRPGLLRTHALQDPHHRPAGSGRHALRNGLHLLSGMHADAGLGHDRRPHPHARHVHERVQRRRECQ